MLYPKLSKQYEFLKEEVRNMISKDKDLIKISYNHWDLNLFDFLEKGIIDYEMSKKWIVGLDYVNLMFHNLMFWDIWEVSYLFTNEQLLKIVDSYKSIYKDDFLEKYFWLLVLIRGIWWISWFANIEQFVQFRNFRFNKILELTEIYKKGELTIEYLLKLNNKFIKLYK